MALCPNCRRSLRTQRIPDGIYFVCDACGGRSVTLAQLRKFGGDKLVNSLFRQMNAVVEPGPKPCPFCDRRMPTLREPNGPLELDGCRRCTIIWFDGQELEQVAECPPPTTEELMYRGREALILEKIKNEQRSDPLPAEGWQAIPALFGLPVEAEPSPLQRQPLATWGLAAAIAFFSIMALFNLKEIIANLGFVPNEFWRYGGLTLISSFFLHAGLWHLLSNLYFFLIFGDNVEDYLGKRRFLLLVLAATLSGDLLHFILAPHSTVPCVGASGGISGVLAFYALQFPHARLGFMWRFGLVFFRWFELSARTAFIVWIVLQLWTATMQVVGFGQVSGLAHLGGAGVGLLFWLAEKNAAKADPSGSET